MTDKELEQKLQESADQLQLRDFDEVWQEIKDRVVEKPQKKSWWTKKRIAVFSSIAGGLATAGGALAIILPFALQPEIRYLDDELSLLSVQKEEFFVRIQQAKIHLVDLSKTEIFNCYIYHTDKNQTKGGAFEFVEESNNSTCYVVLTFYDKHVEVTGSLNSEYDLNYTTASGATVEYKLKESGSDNYYVKAEYESVQYYMEYTGMGGDITAFFEEFFD